MKREISSITVGKRYRQDLGDIRSLADSIADVGLLHPVVITPDGVLIAGQRRLAACNELDWTDVDVHVVDLEEVVKGQRDENIQRKDFSPSEAVAIWEALDKHKPGPADELLGNLHSNYRRDRAADFTG